MLQVSLFTLFYGKLVGSDEFDNKYYQSKTRNKWWQVWLPQRTKWHRDKRWVVYSKESNREPSSVPARWHMWLHFIIDTPLSEEECYEWQKEHMPNPTGTKRAIYPKRIAKKPVNTQEDNEHIWLPVA